MSLHFRIVVTSALLASLAGCSTMSARERDTALGAAAGGLIGNIMTGGSAIGTVGGAAAGGIIGHELDRRNSRK